MLPLSSRVLLTALMLALAGLLTAVAAGPSSPGPAATVAAPALRPRSFPDPIPILRVWLDDDRAAATLAGPLARGTLVRLPRDQFERRVQQAALATNALPPRLIESRYTAELDGTGLRGTGEWFVRGAGLLPLEPYRLALGQPRVGSSVLPLIRADLAGKPTTSVWIEQSTTEAITVPWSVRGIEEPTADRYDLLFPPAAIGYLDLQLPMGRTPILTGADHLLTGPWPGMTDNRQRWRIALGSGNKLDLAIRRGGDSREPPTLVRANRTARWDLSPGMTTATVDFDLEPVRGTLSTATFEIDPGWQVTDVTGPNRWNWRTEPAPMGRSRVFVVAEEGTPLTRVSLSGGGGLSSGGWAVPEAQLLGALPGTDLLEIRLDPALKLMGYDPGDYRLIAGQIDRGYRLNLTGGIFPAGVNRSERKPPTLTVRPVDAEYASTEELTWRVTPERMELAGRYRIRVSRGPVVQLPLQISPGWTIDGVTITPDDAGVTWSQVGSGQVVIEPSRPWITGQTVQLRIDLHAPVPVTASNDAGPPQVIPFPRASFPQAMERDGNLSLVVGPSWQAWPSPPPESMTEGGQGPLVYPFRGRTPEGELSIRPRRTFLEVATDSTVTLVQGRPSTRTILRVHPLQGEVTGFTLYAPQGPGQSWEWQSSAGTVRPIPGSALVGWMGLFGASQPWGALMSLQSAGASPGALWRVDLPRPTTEPVQITATTTGAGESVAIPWVFGGIRDHGPITLSPGAAAKYELPTGSLPNFPGSIPLLPRIADQVPIPVEGPTRGWRYQQLDQFTQIEADGRRLVTLSGQVLEAAAPTLRIELPPTAQAIRATIADKHVTTEGSSTPTVILPLPASPGVKFTVHYTLPAPDRERRRQFWPRLWQLEPEAIGLPGDPEITSTRWKVSESYRNWPDLAVRVEPITTPSLLLIRTRSLHLIGWVTASLIFTLAIAILTATPIRRGRAVGFAVVAGGLGIATQLLPDGWEVLLRPSLIAALFGMTGLVVLTRRGSANAPGGSVSGNGPKPIPTRWPSTVSVAKAGIILLLGSTAVLGQPTEPTTVYLQSVNTEHGERLMAIVPSTLLERLDSLTRPAIPPVIVSAAEYDGEVTEPGLARVTARFSVDVTREGEQTLMLPLAGIRLEAMSIDGKPAFPDGSQADRYSVTLSGVGWHEVTAQFLVSYDGGGTDREVRFSIPEVPASRVKFRLPTGARQIDVPGRRGAMSPPQGTDRPTITADLGLSKTFIVRWREGSGGNSKASISVREVCVWDLNESATSATAAFVFRVEGGTLSRLVLELPDNLEPGRPILRGSVAAPTPGLRDWQLRPGGNGYQVMTIDLQAPIEGRITVVLRLAARQPGSLRPVLRLPRVPEAVQVDAYAALRWKNLQAEEVGRVGVIDFPVDALSREFANVPELGFDRGVPDRAFQSGTGTAGALELRPVFRVSGEASTVTSETIWSLGARADAEGTVRASRTGGLSLIEFDLNPAVAISEVRTTDLESWSRQGSRVQVWLKKPAKDVVVRWVGSLTGYKPRRTGWEGTRVQLPYAWSAEAGPGGNVLRLRSLEGWAITPAPVGGMKPRPGSTNDPSFTMESPGSLACQIHAPRPPAGLQRLEVVEAGPTGVRYRAVVAIPWQSGRPHSFTLRLPEQGGMTDVTLAGPSDVRISPATSERGSTRWSIQVPATAADPGLFVLAAQVPADAPIPEPQLLLDGLLVNWSERAVVVGPGLQVDPVPSGWVAVTEGDLPALVAAWPGEAQALNRGSVWWNKQGGSGWRVSIPRPALPASGPDLGTPPAAMIDTPIPPIEEPESWAETLVTVMMWIVGLVVLIALTRLSRHRSWPERLTLAGVLGAVAVGVTTPTGWLFLGLSGGGILARSGWVARRIARSVLR